MWLIYLYCFSWHIYRNKSNTKYIQNLGYILKKQCVESILFWNPSCKKLIQVINISLKLTDFWKQRRKFKLFYFFYANFYAKTWWTIQTSEIRKVLMITLFTTVKCVEWNKIVFFSRFCWYFEPWIRVRGSVKFCRSGS